jgi:hypothetical protein
LIQCLSDDQVDQLVFRAAVTEDPERLPSGLSESLKARRLLAATAVLRQEHVLREVVTVLDEGVPYVVLKGALARHLLYEKPYLRPSADIDVLVMPAHAHEAIRRLQRRGFAITLAAHSDTHEATLQGNGVAVDLHWHLLRPGRMRVDITDEIVADRVRRGDLWGPGDAHLTVIMLVHPAITDHVTGRLITAVDLDRWLRNGPVPWDETVEILGRIGLRTAAWAMLRWTHDLFATPVPEEVWRAIAPSPLRRKHIETWLQRHPARLYRRHPMLVRGAFSLALQDRAADAVRALFMLARKDRLTLQQVQSRGRDTLDSASW